MRTTRREAAGIFAGMAASAAAPAIARGAGYDVAVVGAGVFGAWTAYALHKQGLKVCLIDTWGAAHSRASSGGETRITRCSYGAKAVYSRWSMQSLAEWTALDRRAAGRLFEPTGVLAISSTKDSFLDDTAKTLTELGIVHQRLTDAEAMRRFPMFHLASDEGAIFEPRGGALMARRAVQTLVAEMVAGGLAFQIGTVRPPAGPRRLPSVLTAAGETVAADHFVFACGPWLGRVLPDVVGKNVDPQRAQVFFLGTPAGSTRFTAPAMPTWMDTYGIDGAYGFPDLEARGCKLAVDGNPVPIDPDTDQRTVTEAGIAAMREFAAMRLPELAKAPIIETRVCQYEVSPDEDYILDAHPAFDNVWIAGGGSGHGFKNGPMVGRYVAGLVTGTDLGAGHRNPLFALGRFS